MSAKKPAPEAVPVPEVEQSVSEPAGRAVCAVCGAPALHDLDDAPLCLKHLIEATEPERAAERLARFDAAMGVEPGAADDA